MRHRLTGVRALVDHQAISVAKPFLLGNLLRRVEKVQVVACLRQFGYAGNLLPGNDQDMGRRFGLDISKRNHVIVFVNDVCRDFPIDDSGEKRRHRWHYDQNFRHSGGARVSLLDS